MSVQIAKRLLTVGEYHRMAGAGILDEDDRVELIHGEIIRMGPIGSRHASHVKRINALLARLVKTPVIISIQDPISINDYSEPEPDIALLKFRKDFYESAHPRPEDVLLVIEVADSSVNYDREVKLPLFAGADIPEVWIVNIEDGQIEVYRKPEKLAYGQQEIFKKGGSLRFGPLNLTLQTADILG